MNEESPPIEYTCPYCKDRKIETGITATYIRGALLVHWHGGNQHVGCVSCLRMKLFGEACLSCVIGWFSVTAIICNPFYILTNLIKIPFVKVDYAKARMMLAEAGIPLDEEPVDLTSLCYSLAASMIAADGRIEEEEIEVARTTGRELLNEFNDSEFDQVMENADSLPAPEGISALLGEILDDDQKKAVFSYLWSIAEADGNFDKEEEKLLIAIGTNMQLDPSDLSGP